MPFLHTIYDDSDSLSIIFNDKIIHALISAYSIHEIQEIGDLKKYQFTKCLIEKLQKSILSKIENCLCY